MLVAVGLGALSVVVGLVISFHHGTAGGASIAAVAVVQFLVVLAAQEGLAAVRHRRHHVAPA
jgi:ABC-type Mn2+/Zn2+ transport system permease subunit